MKVHVNQDKCVSSTQCVMRAKRTFDLNDEGKSYVKNPHGDPEDVIRKAAQYCPAHAIIIEEDAE
ncbi:MAG: ferredoxin [Firmicutes bacterium]|nr:ferredoxin [Bacillota bacterium]